MHTLYSHVKWFNTEWKIRRYVKKVLIAEACKDPNEGRGSGPSSPWKPHSSYIGFHRNLQVDHLEYNGPPPRILQTGSFPDKNSRGPVGDIIPHLEINPFNSVHILMSNAGLIWSQTLWHLDDGFPEIIRNHVQVIRHKSVRLPKATQYTERS